MMLWNEKGVNLNEGMCWIPVLFLLLFVGCSRSHYQFGSQFSSKIKVINFSLKLPDIQYATVENVSIEGKRHMVYTYPDSSVFYLSNLISLNEAKLTVDEQVTQLNYLAHITIRNQKRLVFSGVDSNNLYWKEIVIGPLMIGYQNSQGEQKQVFEKALSSLKPRVKYR